MTEIIGIIQETLTKYDGEGEILALFGLCTALLWLLRKGGSRTEEGRREDQIVLYSFLTAVLTLFPLTAFFIVKCIGGRVYWRMAWILPITIVIAYCGVRLLGGVRKKALKVLVFLLLCMTAVGVGENVYNGNVFQKYTNSYKLPEEVVQICDMLTEDAGENEIFLAAPEEINPYVRVYDAEIRQAFGRDASQDQSFNSPESLILYDILDQNPTLMESAAAAARLRGCNYMVLKKEEPDFGKPEDLHLRVVGETENYVVVYVEKM